MAELYYLVGPSGVGKDSLLRALQNSDRIKGLRVARRYITRAPIAGAETNIELSPVEYERRQRSGDFLFAWDSHGYRYAIDRNILDWLNAGDDVVVNGSRAYLGKALNIYPRLVPVWMTVAEEQLRSRLQARGRETEAEIERRIHHGRELEAQRDEVWHSISNDGTIEQAMGEFLALRRTSR